MASVDTSLLPHPVTRNHVRPCWTGPTFAWSAEAQWRQGPSIAAHLHHKVGPERTEKLHQRPHQERVGFRLSHLSLFVTLVHLSHLSHSPQRLHGLQTPRSPVVSHCITTHVVAFRSLVTLVHLSGCPVVHLVRGTNTSKKVTKKTPLVHLVFYLVPSSLLGVHIPCAHLHLSRWSGSISISMRLISHVPMVFRFPPVATQAASTSFSCGGNTGCIYFFFVSVHVVRISAALAPRAHNVPRRHFIII